MADAPLTTWDDPRVQEVYQILTADDAPPEGEHWEGFVARKIVDALSAAPSPPVAAPPATPVDSELWTILVDVNSALEDGVDALSEMRVNFREAYKGHRPEEHAAKERDLLNAEDARARLAEYMDRPRLAAQPQPQPAQPLTDARIAELHKELCADPSYKTGTWFAYVVRFVERAHGITAPSTPTPPEVAP